MPSALRCLLALLVLSSAAHALAPKPAGVVLWRVPLDGAIAAQPAVSASGLVAVATEKGVRVLNANGSLAWEIADAQLPFQPMWAGDRLWYRTKDGWRWRQGEETGPACKAPVQSGAVDDEGRAVFALEGELVACGEERTIIARRRGREGQVWPVSDGWITSDEWSLEFFDRAGTRRGTRLVTDVGYPAGVTPQGGVLVTTPGGRLDLLDSRGFPVWQGPPGADGPPVFLRGGALVISGGREVRVVDPPQTIWSLPVAAGARAIAALDGGAVALLERTGHLGLVREGRLVWSRTLQNPGNVLGAHPDGFLLVQDAGALVAISAPPPDALSAYPVAGGLARNGRAQSGADAVRCPPPPPPSVSRDVLHVDGPAFVRGETCLFPPLEMPCAKGRCLNAPKIVNLVACGATCSAAATTGEVAIADERGQLKRYDAKGRVRATVKLPGTGAPRIDLGNRTIAVLRGRDLITVDQRGKSTITTLDKEWRAGPRIGASIAGLTQDGALVLVSGAKTTATLLPKATTASTPRIAWFGQTACAQAETVAGCVVADKAVPPLSLAPRTAWFGDAVLACEDGRAICLQGRAGELQPFARLSAPIDAFLPLGDGSLAVLAGETLSALWPSGETRWSVTMGKPEACEGERWIVRIAPDTLAVRGCGQVAWLALPVK